MAARGAAPPARLAPAAACPPGLAMLQHLRQLPDFDPQQCTDEEEGCDEGDELSEMAALLQRQEQEHAQQVGALRRQLEEQRQRAEQLEEQLAEEQRHAEQVDDLRRLVEEQRQRAEQLEAQLAEERQHTAALVSGLRQQLAAKEAKLVAMRQQLEGQQQEQPQAQPALAGERSPPGSAP